MDRGLERVRQAARGDRKQRFTALLHHVYNVEALGTAYHGLKRDAAAGIDGETWGQYGGGLEEHLQDLAGRLQRGAYRAKPVRRAYILKADGRLRPLGVPALEDKVVQRAVVAVLHAIYEVDFLGFSYGFRPGRRPHQALDARGTEHSAQNGVSATPAATAPALARRRARGAAPGTARVRRSWA